MRFQDLILLMLIVMVWGFNFVVIKVGLHDIPPLTLCSLRFLLTGIPAVFFLKRPEIPFKTLVTYGLTMFALQFGFLFAGIYAGVTSGLAALITQIQVIFTVVLAAFFLNDKPNVWQMLGILVAFLGIMFVGFELEGSVPLLGFLFIVAAGGFWSVGNLMAKKIGSVNMFSLVIWGNLIAFFPTFACAVFFEGTDAMSLSYHKANLIIVAAIMYLVYFSTMFGYGTWSWLVKNYPIATIAPYALLVPILGFLSSALVLHEPLQSWKIIAAVMVILGLCINYVGSKVSSRKN